MHLDIPLCSFNEQFTDSENELKKVVLTVVDVILNKDWEYIS